MSVREGNAVIYSIKGCGDKRKEKDRRDNAFNSNKLMKMIYL